MAWGIGINLSWLVGNYFSFHSRQAARERKSPVPSSHPQWIGSILLTQGPIHEIFMKKYWELTKPWKWLLFSFLVFGYWVVQKKKFSCFSVWKKPRRFIWGSIYSCTMDGFFRIFKKAVSELICTRLYIKDFSPVLCHTTGKKSL